MSLLLRGQVIVKSGTVVRVIKGRRIAVSRIREQGSYVTVHGAVLTCRKSRLHSEGERLRAGLMSLVFTCWDGIL